MVNRQDQLNRSEQREAEVVNLDAIREVRTTANQALELHRQAVERDLILHEALFGAVHEAALEGFIGDSEKKPDETQAVQDMWAAKLRKHMESPEHRAAQGLAA